MTNFVNRDVELAELDGLLSGEVDAGFVVAAIAGPPGVGKTALAVHWAHRIRDQFPDGDLYIDLGGHGSRPGIGTDEALDSLLRSMRVPPDQLPTGVQARAAMFRSMLAGKRLLLVIDNVATAADTRPLLPGSMGCLVVLTSRSSLSGLVARDGARRVVLSTLRAEESLTLFRRVIGHSRVDQEAAAAARLTDLCAHLPLALRIAAERIATQRWRSLASFVAELEGERARLDRFSSIDDDDIDIRAVFSSSYRALSPALARTFRLLTLHSGRSFSALATSALVGIDSADAGRQLESLAGSHLLQNLDGRYQYHDLLLEYAAEMARSDEPQAARSVARRRMLAWYLIAVEAARRVVLPSFHTVGAAAGGPTLRAPDFRTVDQAWAWFEEERPNLVQAVQDASASGELSLAWRLPAAMYPLFELRQYWAEWLAIQRIGLAAAERSADSYGAACSYLGLGDVHWLLQHREEALTCYTRATELGRTVQDGWVEGFGLRQAGIVLLELGRVAAAVPSLLDALAVFRRTGERRGEGMTLLSLAAARRATGEFAAELRDAEGGRDILASIADPWSAAWARCAVGQALLDTGEPARARAQFEAALPVFQNFGNRRNEGRALLGAAIAAGRIGDRAAAEKLLAMVDEIMGELDDDLAAELREMMVQLDRPGQAPAG
ncbi:MAG TPA: NB-ARC domain-containing protein [Mycobacteriales bacterium]|nr:NB-ARC domain-containing protein [Mycobacteriales bacterium]